MRNKNGQVRQRHCLGVPAEWLLVKNVVAINQGWSVESISDIDYLQASYVVSHRTRFNVDREVIICGDFLETCLGPVSRDLDRALYVDDVGTNKTWIVSFWHCEIRGSQIVHNKHRQIGQSHCLGVPTKWNFVKNVVAICQCWRVESISYLNHLEASHIVSHDTWFNVDCKVIISKNF